VKTENIIGLSILGIIAYQTLQKSDAPLQLPFGGGGGGSSFDFSNLFGGAFPQRINESPSNPPDFGGWLDAITGAIDKGFSEIPDNPFVVQPPTPQFPNLLPLVVDEVIPVLPHVEPTLPIDLIPNIAPYIPEFIQDSPDITLPTYTETKEAIVRTGGVAVRQYAGAALTGTHLIKPLPKAAVIEKFSKPIVKVAPRIATKVIPRVGVKVASRAVPVLGWALLAGDIGSDVLRFFGADMPEWLGISGIVESFTGENPIESWVTEQEAIEFQGSEYDIRETDLVSPETALTISEARHGQPEAPTRGVADYPQPGETPIRRTPVTLTDIRQGII
tara:strand:+ start:2667 stop:3662 length:996 start_codon:yes stop_codon:yes gene_type:complete